MGSRSQNLGIRGQNLGLRGLIERTQARIQVFSLDVGHFAWIWAILLGFRPYNLDLGPKEDKAWRGEGRTDVWRDKQIPTVFYRTLSPSGPLPKKVKIDQRTDKRTK